MAVDFAPTIRVNALCPGMVERRGARRRRWTVRLARRRVGRSESLALRHARRDRQGGAVPRQRRLVVHHGCCRRHRRRHEHPLMQFALMLESRPEIPFETVRTLALEAERCSCCRPAARRPPALRHGAERSARRSRRLGRARRPRLGDDDHPAQRPHVAADVARSAVARDRRRHAGSAHGWSGGDRCRERLARRSTSRSACRSDPRRSGSIDSRRRWRCSRLVDDRGVLLRRSVCIGRRPRRSRRRRFLTRRLRSAGPATVARPHSPPASPTSSMPSTGPWTPRLPPMPRRASLPRTAAGSRLVAVLPEHGDGAR